MEAVETQEQATEQEKGTVKITICKSLRGIAEGAELVYQEFEKQNAGCYPIDKEEQDALNQFIDELKYDMNIKAVPKIIS